MKKLRDKLMETVIQRSTYPSMSLCPETKLFFRCNEWVEHSVKQHFLFLYPHGIVDTSTYFNSLSVGKWKMYCHINDMHLRIKFRGEMRLTFKFARMDSGSKIVQENLLISEKDCISEIELSCWQRLQGGMLYFELYALDTSVLYHFEYVTYTLPVNQVKLGIVITHYNRQERILPALERLKESLLSDPDYGSRSTLVVIDNSQNLPPVEQITVIKNRNLGGAGGFSRGLIYLKNQREFTHCLFMDDDASCYTESIKRTIALLSFIADPKVAISGAMLMEREPYRQYEAGAYMDSKCHSLGKGYNLTYQHDLLKNELPRRAEYGAWWFFAFALQGVEHNPFPYFVRGDDISFSYSNRFKILTVNGICSWQPDFGNKNSPLTSYLDMRYHLMHALHGFSHQPMMLEMLKSLVLMYAYHATAYYYDSAQAINTAMIDILKGPDFWRDNVDMQNKRCEINESRIVEVPQVISADIFSKGVMARVEQEYAVSFRQNLPKDPISLMRYASLNGHLIPTIFFHPGFVWLRRSSGSRGSSIFRYKKAVFINDEDNTCLVLRLDKKRFFSLTWQFICLIVQLFLKYKRLSQNYRDTYDQLTSDEFWQQQFDKGKNE